MRLKTGGQLFVLTCLRRAMRAERGRALAGRSDYDVSRHLALYSAVKREEAELAKLERCPTRNAPAAPRGLRQALAARSNTP